MKFRGNDQSIDDIQAKPNNDGPRSSSRHPVGFLHLPPEVRNTIYKLTITDKDGQWLSDKHRREYRLRPSHLERVPPDLTELLAPKLVLASRQVHEEANAMLYSNTIRLENQENLRDFLRVIGASNRQLLRSLRIDNWESCDHPTKSEVWQLLGECTGLDHIHWYAHRTWFNKITAREIAGDIWDHGQSFLRKVGAREGKADAALDILHLSSLFVLCTSEETVFYCTNDFFWWTVRSIEEMKKAVKEILRGKILSG